MGVTLTTSQSILKTLWPDSRVENLVYEDHAFLAMIGKREDFYGENMYLAVRYADTQGRSATFARAQANKGAFAGKRFLLTRAKDYQLFGLETEAILASKNDKGALIKSLDTEMETAFNNISKSLAVKLFRGSSGAIGQIGAITATTITLLNINDVTSFEVGLVLEGAATKTGATRATPARATITAVDRDTGVLTFGAGTFTGTNWAVNDYVFPDGDSANNGGTALNVLGLDDWIPSTAPSATLFCGVDRSVDTTRLGGLRIDVSALNPEEALVTAFSRQAREGGKPNVLMVNHLDFRNIEISLGSKVVYDDLSVGQIGFSTIKVKGPKGDVRIVADQDCPSGVGYSLDMRTWKLYSLEKCPQILDLDGNKLSREATADSWEGRIAYFAQTGCKAPGWNARLSMPA